MRLMVPPVTPADRLARLPTGEQPPGIRITVNQSLQAGRRMSGMGGSQAGHGQSKRDVTDRRVVQAGSCKARRKRWSWRGYMGHPRSGGGPC